MTEQQSEIVKRAGALQAHDRLAVERWISEGGHIAREAVIARELAAVETTLDPDMLSAGELAHPTAPGRSTDDTSPSRTTGRLLARSQP